MSHNHHPVGFLHRPTEIPKLQIHRAKNNYDETLQPVSARRMPSMNNGDWGPITGKVTSSPRPEVPMGLEKQPLSERSRIPGYAGFRPANESYLTGKSYGLLTSLVDRDTLRIKTARDTIGSKISRFGHDEQSGLQYGMLIPPMTARTRAEERLLEQKTKRRAVDVVGAHDLNLLRLATTTPRQSFRSQHEVESSWKSTIKIARPPTLQLPDDRAAALAINGPPPYGVPPDREDHEWRVGQEFLRQFPYAARAWDPSLDRRYTLADPSMGWTASGPFEVPKGWMAYGLHVPDEHMRNPGFWTSWNTVFFPCPAEWLETVLAKLECVIPGDTLVSGEKIKIVHMSQKNATEKVDPNAPMKDRNCTRLYTTPSIRYASAKVASLTRGGGFATFQDRNLYFVIECKQKGGPLYAGGFQVCTETVGWDDTHPRGEPISPYFGNHEIEYYTMRKSSVVPYRVLVMTDDARMVETRSAGGTHRQQPEMTWHETKSKRKDQPQYGSAGTPGLSRPFRDFLEHDVDATVQEGGTTCPRPSVPFVSFPERDRLRDTKSDPRLRLSAQLVDPEAPFEPSHGSLAGALPDSLKNFEGRRVKSLSTLRAEIKDKFTAADASVSDLFARLASHSGGYIKKAELERVLQRINVVRKGNVATFSELWASLDPEGLGKVSLQEFGRQFGLLSKVDAALELVKRKLGSFFVIIHNAFTQADHNGDGKASKAVLQRLMQRDNMLAEMPTALYLEVCIAVHKDIDTDVVAFHDFVQTFANNASNAHQVLYGPPSARAARPRTTYKEKGSVAWNVSGMCEEGNTCYFQKEYDEAEKLYCAALRIDPKHVHTLCSFAWLVKTVKGDIPMARGLIRRALEAEPTNPFVVMQEGMY